MEDCGLESYCFSREKIRQSLICKHLFWSYPCWSSKPFHKDKVLPWQMLHQVNASVKHKHIKIIATQRICVFFDCIVNTLTGFQQKILHFWLGIIFCIYMCTRVENHEYGLIDPNSLCENGNTWITLRQSVSQSVCQSVRLTSTITWIIFTVA